MEKVYYEEIGFLQFDYETEEFEKLFEEGNEKAMFRLAAEYWNAEGLNEEETYKKAERYNGDVIMVENKDFVLVRNLTVGGTWTIYKKWNVEDVIKELSELGNYANCSEDMNDLINEVLKEWKQG